MNAIKFIQQHGVEKARRVIEGAPDGATHLSVDANAGVTVITPKGTSKVKGGMTAFVDMGDDSHIENHVSPLCKVGGE